MFISFIDLENVLESDADIGVETGFFPLQSLKNIVLSRANLIFMTGET